MRKAIVVLLGLGALFGTLATAQSQVATVEFQGVDMTMPHSPGVSGWLSDASVGEARIVLKALDAAGNAVPGAQVAWSITNSTDQVVYAVATSAVDELRATAYTGHTLVVDGGTTGPDGLAYLILDSLTAGDAKAAATVDGMAATTYDGKDTLRVVWF